jgi:hypothetical protein
LIKATALRAAAPGRARASGVRPWGPTRRGAPGMSTTETEEHSAIAQLLVTSLRWHGVSIRVKQPQAAGERRWNRAQDVLSPIVLFTPIALKLTGVITWSWWWVLLSPAWISAVLLALLVTGLAILPLKILPAKRPIFGPGSLKHAKPWSAS